MTPLEVKLGNLAYVRPASEQAYFRDDARGLVGLPEGDVIAWYRIADGVWRAVRKTNMTPTQHQLLEAAKLFG